MTVPWFIAINPRLKFFNHPGVGELFRNRVGGGEALRAGWDEAMSPIVSRIAQYKDNACSLLLEPFKPSAL